MKTKDIVAGLIIVIVLVTAVLVYKNIKNRNSQIITSPTPNYQTVESKFPSLKVPQNADRASLSSVGYTQGQGEAFRTYENGKFSLTIIADLPVPDAGHFYQGWIAKDNSYLSLGKLSITKGGYMVQIITNKDYSANSKVVVTLEKGFDDTPETHVLEGSF